MEPTRACTALRLDRRLLRAARLAALQRGQSLNQYVTEALRAQLWRDVRAAPASPLRAMLDWMAREDPGPPADPSPSPPHPARPRTP